MTVSEMIEWLKTQDQGATVYILIEKRGGSWQPNWVTNVPFDPAEHSDYIDMRGNPHAVGKPYENDRTLYLGQES